WLMMSLWDALRMNMMISYQELVRTFPSIGVLKIIYAYLLEFNAPTEKTTKTMDDAHIIILRFILGFSST
ncbi:hypothetical protein ASU98_22615, partial [Enterobacter hormaechei subsp. steigerwaltii]